MILSSNNAKKLLEEITNDETKGWIAHCICVGDTAFKIAKALKEKGMNIDPDKAKTMGYIHDIGKIKDDSSHTISGYYYLKERGIDEEYCAICLTHSFINNDINCTAGGFPKSMPFRDEYVKNYNYSIYDKIINLCDLMCTKEVLTLDERMSELIKRKGYHKNTEYHLQEAHRLKNYFDDLIGYDLNNLFK